MKKNDAKTIELSELENNPVDQQNLVERDLGLVKNVEVELTAKLGSASITLDKLFSLQAGEVLALNETVDTPLELELDGKVVAKGLLVAVDNTFAVKITAIKHD
ncbi:MAG: FliM/FliN family flagellar motor C-terminal domain-containing protein [Pseudomonadota bacterium]